MAPIERQEPQRARDYGDRTTAAVRRVLVEMGQILGSFRDKFVVIGGAVPWLLLNNEEMPHIGTLDIDVGLDARALGDGEYATLVESLKNQGYQQREQFARFQLVRQIDMGDGGASIAVVVDFLMPRKVRIAKNRPPLVRKFAVQKADGVDLALRFSQYEEIEGQMPTGGTNRVRVAVASIPAFLAMKGFAIQNRDKAKDAYDIYYCVRNYPGGAEVLAEACRALTDIREAVEAYGYIAAKFEAFDSFGPTRVREFVEGSDLLDDRTPDQWQQDAFGQVNAWLGALKNH